MPERFRAERAVIRRERRRSSGERKSVRAGKKGGVRDAADCQQFYGGGEVKKMSEQNLKLESAAELSAEQRRAQKAVASEFRRLREAQGMTREDMAQKMGHPYTAELVAQYEDGSETVMEIWPVFEMAKVLGVNLNDLIPEYLIARNNSANEYAALDDESRSVADRVIHALLTERNTVA